MGGFQFRRGDRHCGTLGILYMYFATTSCMVGYFLPMLSVIICCLFTMWCRMWQVVWLLLYGVCCGCGGGVLGCGVWCWGDVEVRQSQWYCWSHQPTQIIPDYWNTHSKMWVVGTTQYGVTWVSRQSSFRNPGFCFIMPYL